MPGIYSATRSNFALNTSNDAMTFVGASARTVRFIRISIGGMGTAAAANELLVMRSSSGTTGGGGITPSPHRVAQAAAAVTVFTTWSTQPTAGVALVRLPVGANGGINTWVARPGEEIELNGTEQLSLRSAVGTSNVSLQVTFEEL